MIRYLSFIIVMWLFGVNFVYGYSQATHEKISEEAFNISNLLAVPDISRNIGLEPESLKTQQFPNANGTPSTIVNLIRYGAYMEDEGTRPLNHFYDPFYDRPLTVAELFMPANSLDSDGYIFRHNDFFTKKCEKSPKQFFKDYLDEHKTM